MAFQRSSDNFSNKHFSCQFCHERLSTENEMRTHLMQCGTKTEQCPRCKKYIQRSIFVYHKDNNCADLNLYDESSNQRRAKTFEPFFETATRVHVNLRENHYQTELDHVAEKLQFNIIVMGSPRVGKSELINALCNGQNRAETSSSLNSCTKEIRCYVLEDNQQRHPNIKPFKINFYDTPGIESWNNQAGEMTMTQFIERTDPVCVIYCASPGSFASLNQIHSMLAYCKTKEIFCALVCTNMWSGNKRKDVINEFEKELEFFGEKIDKYSYQPHCPAPHKITFFGKGALCTMVNSKEYFDNDLIANQNLPVQGIDELIHGIMESLDQEKLLGWCYAVLYRRTYWEKINQNIGGFFTLRREYFQTLRAGTLDGTATNIINSLRQLFE
jgi:GTPase Era involved in 16S rRNA processing